MNNTQMNIDRAQTDSFATTETARKRRKKVRFKPNKEGMLALLALIVIVALVVTALVFAIKGIITAVENGSETTTNNQGNNPPTLPWNNAYAPIPHSNSNLGKGELVLVNSKNAYALADALKERGSTNLYQYEGHGSSYVLPGSDVRVSNTMLQPLMQMIADMVEANPDTIGANSDDRLYISGAYRDIELQTTLNTNNPTTYPELPGYSEHHTGLAVDFKIMSKSTPISMRDAEYQWLEENCMKYGFIFRYGDSKVAITGMNEPYHLRYVGVPHATYMSDRDLCLEEYLELLRNNHSYDKTPLEITAGEKEYIVYYVAANTADATGITSIPVPPASEGTYTVSGDNMSGFIVTVEKTAATAE